MAADCKSAAPCGLRRFESSPVHGTIEGAASEKWKIAEAHVAQLVERVLGKDEVTSSILVVGSWSLFGIEGVPMDGPVRCNGLPLLGGSNSVARVTAFQAVGRGFESRLPLLKRNFNPT